MLTHFIVFRYKPFLRLWKLKLKQQPVHDLVKSLHIRNTVNGKRLENIKNTNLLRVTQENDKFTCAEKNNETNEQNDKTVYVSKSGTYEVLWYVYKLTSKFHQLQPWSMLADFLTLLVVVTTEA